MRATLSRPQPLRRAAIALALGLSSACVPPVESESIKVPAYPDPQGTARTSKERHELPSEILASASGNIIDVTMQQRTECRTITSTPMLQEQGEERHLRGGALSHVANGGLAGILVGIGGWLALSPCTHQTMDATSMNPNPPMRPCTSDEASGQKTAGYIVMGTALIPAGLIVVNALRSKDETKIVPTTVASGAAWETCETKPIPNADIAATIGPAIIRGTTGSDGHARLDISEASVAPDLASADAPLHSSFATRDGSVNLSNTPLFANWKPPPKAMLAAHSTGGEECERACFATQSPCTDKCAEHDGACLQRCFKHVYDCREGCPPKSASETAQSESDSDHLGLLVARARRHLANNGGEPAVPTPARVRNHNCALECKCVQRGFCDRAENRTEMDPDACRLMCQVCIENCVDAKPR